MFIQGVSNPLLELYLFHHFLVSTYKLVLDVRVIDSACGDVDVPVSVMVMFPLPSNSLSPKALSYTNNLYNCLIFVQ